MNAEWRRNVSQESNAEWRRNISKESVGHARNDSSGTPPANNNNNLDRRPGRRMTWPKDASYTELDRDLSNGPEKCQSASKPSKRQGLANTKTNIKSSSRSKSVLWPWQAHVHHGHGRVKGARRMVANCLRHNAFDLSLGMIICLDVIFNVADIDARAVGQSPPMWANIGAKTCLAVYTVELLLNVFVSGLALFKNRWSVMDFCIIFSGWLEVILMAYEISAKEFTLLRLLRLLRILRLMKLCRHHRWLTELKKLVMMMASCLRTLFWSFMFCFIVMSAWSMAAVELVNPVVQQMAADGAFGDCRSCGSALTSVMRANLMMFQTIIAGDSWGDLAVPVIEAHPWTAIIFIGSLLTLVFGVLNLIVAVVIDTYAEHRQKDVMNLAQELDAEAAEDKRFLQKIFDQIDEDGSGELNLAEVLLAAKTHPEFKSRLRVMDIDEQDLVQMFEMIDGDGSGSVDPEEFITALNRWANHSKTAARFAKYQMMRSIVRHEELHVQVVSKLDRLEKSLNSDKFNLKEEKLITVVADDSPLADQVQVGGSGELAGGFKRVTGSESEETATPGGTGRSYGPDFCLGRQRQTGFYFPHESRVGGKESTLEPEAELSLKTAIAAAILALKESGCMMAAAEEAMTDSFLAAELTLSKAMPKSSGTSGSCEKRSLRQSVAALANGCRAVGAAPLNRAGWPLIGPRGPQSTYAVRFNSKRSAPPSPPSACRVSSNSRSNNNNRNDNAAADYDDDEEQTNNNNNEEQLGVQGDPPVDGPVSKNNNNYKIKNNSPEQHPASNELFI
ncbi:unnamed protein product [Polarella glacialis]|uniref:EF-hand domain-containing protein n=1 Tax=Polarella glacialis TaxID=89957 RepID=A0A813GUZ0_POLGL|nr:unnamed protein product [Polarella glacialis]